MNTVQFPKIGLEFTLNQDAFSIFGVDIKWYAVIISVGFILAVVYALFRMKEFGLDSDRAIDAILIGLVGGLVGARLYFVAFSWDQYKNDLSLIFNVRQGGLAIYGGLIGALILGGLACKLRKVKLLPMFDITVLGFLIGQAIGRWGNFVNVEAYGAPTDSFFGMTSSAIPDGPVHPCFLYESVWCLVGFILLHIYSKKRKFDGEILLMYLAWYGFGRMWIEGLRQDSLYWGPFRVSQMLSAVLVIVALIVWLTIRSRIKRNNDPEYLKLYVDTEESKQLLKQAAERNQKKSDPVIEQSLEDGVEALDSEKLQEMNEQSDQVLEQQQQQIDYEEQIDQEQKEQDRNNTQWP